MKKLLSSILVFALLVVAILSFSSCGKYDEVTVRMTVKDYGTVDILLDGKSAPITVKNFVRLVEDGFYDGLTFHRVVNEFMIQGGDPKGNGTGGSEPITGEFSENGIDNPIKHERGVISMARRGDSYDSGSCQFFIVHKTSEANTEALDGKYAAFGHVIAGMEVIDKMIADAQYANVYDEIITGTVSNPCVIESIVVLED